jgi:hypothetical protein
VKSPFASHIEPLMILSSPWRLGLLFMISGVATAFMLKKYRVGALLRQRLAAAGAAGVRHVRDRAAASVF